MKQVSILTVDKFVFFPANFLGGRMEKTVLVLDTFFPSRVLVWKNCHRYPGWWYYNRFFKESPSSTKHTPCPSSFIIEKAWNSGKVVWTGFISDELWNTLSEVHDSTYPEDKKYRFCENYANRGIKVESPEKMDVDEIFGEIREIKAGSQIP